MTRLVELAKDIFNDKERKIINFVEDEKHNMFLNNIEKYPHAFVLACLMDKQMKAERAWSIPCKIYDEFGRFDIDFLSNVEEQTYINLFNKNKYHRFNKIEAKNFYDAVQMIKNKYNGDASNIWKDKPSSATVVYRFLEFNGMGIKIATMAANILARQFKIEFSDYYSIDISPDVHVKRVLKRLGYLNENSTIDQIIYKAREINPEFPGLIDYSCWVIGRNYCHETNPDCDKCPLNSECKKKYIK